MLALSRALALMYDLNEFIFTNEKTLTKLYHYCRCGQVWSGICRHKLIKIYIILQTTHYMTFYQIETHVTHMTVIFINCIS